MQAIKGKKKPHMTDFSNSDGRKIEIIWKEGRNYQTVLVRIGCLILYFFLHLRVKEKKS